MIIKKFWHNFKIKWRIFVFKAHLIELNSDNAKGLVEEHAFKFLSKYYAIKIIKLEKQLW